MNDGRWTILACCLLVFSDSVAMASEQADWAKLSSQSAQQLWQSRISAPQSEKDKKYKNELQRLIAQIRSIKFEPKNQGAKAAPPPSVERGSGRAIAIEAVPITEPNEILSITAASQQPMQEKQTHPRLDGGQVPYKPVSSQTLQMLENTSQQSEQLCKAFELAEILFLSGYLKRAAMFYQQALNRRDPNDVTSAQDRAWILFQIGNCLMVSDQAGDDLLTAKKMYGQLIAEYPNCPWIDLAKARENLIDWYLNDKPHTLIAECK